MGTKKLSFFFDLARNRVFRCFIRVVRIPCDGERFNAQISGDIINRPAFSGALLYLVADVCNQISHDIQLSLCPFSHIKPSLERGFQHRFLQELRGTPWWHLAGDSHPL